MDPLTIALGAATLLKAGAALFTGWQGSQAGQIQTMIARGNADVLDREAKMQEADAGFSLQRGAFGAYRVERAGEKVAGGQAGYFGATGLDASSGSPLLFQAASVSQASRDVALARAQGSLDYAAGLGRVAQTVAQAGGQRVNALIGDQKAAQSMFAGVLGAGTALLSGVSQMWPGLGASPGKAGPGFTVNAEAPINAGLGGIT